MQDDETDPAADKPARAPGDLAHELGNRLAAIIAFSHLIRTDPRLPLAIPNGPVVFIETHFGRRKIEPFNVMRPLSHYTLRG